MLTSSELLIALRANHLLEHGQFEELERSLRDGRPTSERIVEELKRKRLLTSFQAEHLLGGRAPDLVLDGTYLLMDLLGEGGMGRVYKAKHLVLESIRAVKVIHGNHEADDRAVERFHREVKMVARLKHPNVIAALDAGSAAGVHYFVMEHVEGSDLSKLVVGPRRLKAGEATEYARQAALGLQHAHENGLVHRDVKPSNLLLTRDGRTIKVLDLGLARLYEADARAEDNPLTPSGSLMGTPDFMAPEQSADSKTVDCRADVYSLGCTLYKLLTGQAPFPGGTHASKIYRHCHEIAPSIRGFRSDVPSALIDVVERMMAKVPEERPQTAQAVADELMPFCQRSAVLALSVGGSPSTSSWVRPPSAEVESDEYSSAPTLTEPAMPSMGRKRRWRWIPAASVLLLLAVVGLVCYFVDDGDADIDRIGGDKGVNAGAGNNTDHGEPIDLPRNPKAGDVITGAIGMRFAYVPAGKYWMGGGAGKRGDREVTIKTPFYAGVYEVTQSEWQTVMGENPSHFSRTGEGREAVQEIPDEVLKRFPVENVTWDDVQEFIIHLNARKKGNQLIYRLPTEEEWEYVCRGGVNSGESYKVKNPYSFDFYLDEVSTSLSSTKANFDGDSPDQFTRKGPDLGRPCQVGSYKPNCLGIYDLHGNIWEWTSSIEDGGLRRIGRGGSWYSGGDRCRASDPYADVPAFRHGGHGFRLLAVPNDANK